MEVHRAGKGTAGIWQSISSIPLMVSSGFRGTVLCLHGCILPHRPREQAAFGKLLEVAVGITESTAFLCDRVLCNLCTLMHTCAQTLPWVTWAPSPHAAWLRQFTEGLGFMVTLPLPIVNPRKPWGSYLIYLSSSPWGHGRTSKVSSVHT